MLFLRASLRRSVFALVLAIVSSIAVTSVAQQPLFTFGSFGVGPGQLFNSAGVLTVDGSAGDDSRRITVGSNSFSLELNKSPDVMSEMQFTLWGPVGAATAADEFPLPFGIGTMNLSPCVLEPVNPNLFLVADNLGIDGSCSPLVPSNGTPFQFQVPPVPPMELTLQAIVFEFGAPVNLAISNMIIIDSM